MSNVDMAQYIAPKSDQLNADDLIGGPRTIRITAVKASPSTADQPVSISFEGDDGRPWKPCKTTRRVLVSIWGTRGESYVGRSLTLYRDDSVMWGGIKVGGIRISHAEIDAGPTMTASQIADKIVAIFGTDKRSTIAFSLDREHADLDLIAAFLGNAGLGATVDEAARRITVTSEVTP